MPGSKMFRCRLLCSIILIGGLLAACAQASTPILEVAKMPATIVPSAALISRSPVPATPAPSKTPTPTTRPTNAPTHTVTPQDTLSPSDLATRTAVQKVWDYEKWIQATFPLCSKYFYNVQYSPDKNWVVFQCEDQTTVLNRNDRARYWVYTYPQDEFSAWVGYFRVKKWSENGRYLYLTLYYDNFDAICPDFPEGLGLARVDLETGKLTELLDFEDDFQFYSYAIASQDQYLAYSATWLEKPVLKIRDLRTGHEQSVSIKGDYSAIGNIHWSPDNKRVVFAALQHAEGDTCHLYYSVIMVDLAGWKQKTLIDREAEGYFPREWSSDNAIKLSRFYYDEYYILDPNTGLVNPPIPEATSEPTMTAQP